MRHQKELYQIFPQFPASARIFVGEIFPLAGPMRGKMVEFRPQKIQMRATCAAKQQQIMPSAKIIAGLPPSFQDVLQNAGTSLNQISHALQNAPRAAARNLANRIKKQIQRAKQNGIQPPDGPTKPQSPENQHDLKLRELGFKTLSILQNQHNSKSQNLPDQIRPKLTSHELQEMLKAVALAHFQARRKTTKSHNHEDLSSLLPAFPPDAKLIGNQADRTRVFLQTLTNDPEKQQVMRDFAADLVVRSHKTKTKSGTH